MTEQTYDGDGLPTPVTWLHRAAFNLRGAGRAALNPNRKTDSM